MSELSLFEQLNRKKDAGQLKVVTNPQSSNRQTTTDHDSIKQTTTDQVEPRPRLTTTDHAPDSKKTITENKKPVLVETSPSKNFTKVHNSITRQAIPDRYFRGLSKHTYDVLFQQTRGAIIPKRTIQLTKNELVSMTGLSIHAVKLHIKYLKESGLVKSQPSMGNHTGWTYEVFVPEEVESADHGRPRLTTTDHDKTDHNLDSDQDHNLVCLGHTNPLENKEVNEDYKTLFKTREKTVDDEYARGAAPFIQMIGKLNSAAKKITGRDSAENEAEKWGSLADLLILELEKAAKNTNSISSVPAFLTEVLRRQFFATNQTKAKSSKNTARTSGRAKPDQIGKPDEESFAIKPLDAQGREEALAQLQDFAEDDFLESFKKWYAEEDWQWLMSRLKENN